MKRNKAGFTLVEIMIVVLIIALLAAIAIPSFVRARERSRASGCINNLRQIDAAKEQWAMENNANQGDAFAGDLANYIKGVAAGATPTCPSSGTYTIAAIGANPTCSIGGTHALP